MTAFTQPSAQHTVQLTPEDVIDIGNLFRILWWGKWWIITITCLLTMVATYIAYQRTPIYRAEVLLEPVGDENSKGSGMLAKYGGLASMAGINLDAVAGSTNSSNMARMESRVFVGKFIKQENIIPILFSTWDKEEKIWKAPPVDKMPSLSHGVDYFRGMLEVTKSKKSPDLVVLAIEWRDREQAARWANSMVAMINAHLRSVAIDEISQNIKYLQNELANTAITELKQAMVSLLEVEIKKEMVTGSRVEFAFKIIDPAVIAEEEAFVKPKRKMIIFVGMVFGFFGGMFLVFFLHVFRHWQRR